MNRTILCGDIGGTNTRLAVVSFRKRPEILLIKHEETARINNFSSFILQAIAQMKKEHNLVPDSACFGVAGPIQGGKCRLTNSKLVIDSKALSQTKLRVLLINDFAAVGYGINVLGMRDLKTVQMGKADPDAPKAVVGAGTGLGKSILIRKEGHYVPLPSEGGHTDVPLLDPFEYPLAEFILKKRKLKYLNYEYVLSGRGLEDIYDFLQYTYYPRQSRNLPPEMISRTRKKNICSKETFRIFSRLFARCCKNFALDTLALGGVYIAGGIAAKNPDVFGEFKKEFLKNDEYQSLLRKIPVKLVRNQHVGLLGAAFAAYKYFK